MKLTELDLGGPNPILRLWSGYKGPQTEPDLTSSEPSSDYLI